MSILKRGVVYESRHDDHYGEFGRYENNLKLKGEFI